MPVAAGDALRRTPLVAAAVLAAALLTAPGAGMAGPYSLEVRKSERVLLVKSGTRIERRYRIATGRGGDGDKVRSGDKRTPVGIYRIVDFNDDSRFDFFMQLNYPNVKDAFYGLKRELIDRRQFDRIIAALRHGRVPPQNTRLGGLIGIHGLGPVTDEKLHIHEALDWTEGCIALTNAEIRELREFVTLGTRVVISE